MKRITKLRLINWHFFENEEIPFGSINVITGENGSGKSTVLDAIHYLQSGGTCRFNQAANTLSSGRTVANYLKARTGAEGKEFLRDSGDIIGHIACEYFDETTSRPFVLGCVLQLVKGVMSDPRFYTIIGDSYSNELFFEENAIRNFDELYSKGKELGLEIEEVGRKMSERRRKEAVLRALGNPLKYEELFTKALSFEPLQDITRFATDFLLPESPLDLSSIKTTLDSYRLIQEQLRQESRRAEILKPIAENHELYASLLKKRFGYELLDWEAQIQAAIERIKANNIALTIEEAQAKAYKKEADEATRIAYDATNQAEQIRNSEEYKVLAGLEKRKEEVERDYESCKRRVDDWELALGNESSLARRIGTSLDLTSARENQNYEQLLALLEKYRERVREINSVAARERGILLNKQEEVSEQLRNLEEEILQLQANAYAYPPYVEQLMAAIRKRIREEKGVTDVAIFPLCSQLEIADPEWREAVEGLLGKRRFDLFVPRRFVSIAAKVFAESGLQDYFGVGVIAFDPNGEYKVLPNAVSHKLLAYGEDANGVKRNLKEPQAYIDSLLGNVMLVDSIESFKQGQPALMKNGVYFDGNAVRHLLAEDMQKPYIGQQSIQWRLEKDRELKAELLAKSKEIQKHLAEEEKILDETGRSNIEKLLGYDNLWHELRLLAEELSSINKEIDKYKHGHNQIIGLSGLIEDYEKKAAESTIRANKANEAFGLCQQKIGSLKQDSQVQHGIIEETSAKKRERIEESGEDLTSLDEFLALLSQGKKGKELRELVAYSKGPNENEIRRVERIIREAMGAYNASYPNELKPDLENYLAFVQRYNKIVHDELAKLEPEVEAARLKSEVELREHFISSIRASLDEAESSIGGLNRALRHHPFGADREVFEFKGTKSTDSLLGGVYHIAKETRQDAIINDLFSEDLDPESEETLQKVFDILSTNEDDPEFKQQRLELIDYRNYLNYDIKITIEDGASVLYYSKNQDSKSGGETQTPFYALIAGAFQSLLSLPEKQLDSPSCLVCFDEAFNNMDGERIRQMLEFYKELRIQLIISVPSIRFAYISPYADNIIALAKVDGGIGIFTATKDGN